MGKHKYKAGQKVGYAGYKCIIEEVYLFGNFNVYVLKEIEFGTEFCGVWEEDIKELEETICPD